MRVSCDSVRDFLINLKDADTTRVFDRTVYLSKTRSAVDGNQKNAAKYGVTLQLSTVIEARDGGQFLLVAGEFCGYDYTDAVGETEGSRRADKLVCEITEVCTDRGLGILPGIVSE